MAAGELEVELLGYVGTYPMRAEASEPGEPPTRIFDIQDDVLVQVYWEIPESLNRIICGTFDCDLYLESQGKGKEFEIEGPPTPVDQAHNDYHVDISIPAGSIQTRPDETDIVYKMTASVTFKNTLGRPGPIAGFVELPMVQWYKDV
jgi:hypothetical protein